MLSPSQREESCFHLCFSMIRCFDKSIEGKDPPDFHLIYLIIASLWWGSLGRAPSPNAVSGIPLRVIGKMEMKGLTEDAHVMLTFS